jgi:hypothetical protein
MKMLYLFVWLEDDPDVTAGAGTNHGVLLLFYRTPAKAEEKSFFIF